MDIILNIFDTFLAGNIFITFSVDTASQMVPFTEFLTTQGFRPAVSNNYIYCNINVFTVMYCIRISIMLHHAHCIRLV